MCLVERYQHFKDATSLHIGALRSTKTTLRGDTAQKTTVDIFTVVETSELSREVCERHSIRSLCGAYNYPFFLSLQLEPHPCVEASVDVQCVSVGLGHPFPSLV